MKSDAFGKTNIFVLVILFTLLIVVCVFSFHKLNNYAQDGIASFCETTISTQIGSTLEKSEVLIFCRMYAEISLNHHDFHVTHHPVLEEGRIADTKLAKLASAAWNFSELVIDYSRPAILGGIQGLKIFLHISSPGDYVRAKLPQTYEKYAMNFSSDYSNHVREMKEFDERISEICGDCDVQYDESTRKKILNIQTNMRINQRDKDMQRHMNWRLFRLHDAMERPYTAASR